MRANGNSVQRAVIFAFTMIFTLHYVAFNAFIRSASIHFLSPRGVFQRTAFAAVQV